jgi:methylated-DNA-[protein]-cysteine S-methyltransferase
MKTPTFSVFPSSLRWMAMITAGNEIKQLTFGHPTASAAQNSLDPEWMIGAKQLKSVSPLAKRLQSYASGIPEDFRDVRIDFGPMSAFRQRVLNQCRRIPYGKTLSYAELARRAGYPGAARAVGNCMAANRIPLIIPCHRVVCSDGRLGAYSAPGGVRTKRRLLTLESPNSFLGSSQK